MMSSVPKNKPKQKQKQKQKQMQVVNVNVGEVKRPRQVRRRRTAPPPPPSGGGKPLGPLDPFSRMPVFSYSLQAPQPAQPDYLNEYNMLLRELQNERRQRQAAAAPLQPNTAPLVENRQVNDLKNAAASTPEPNALERRLDEVDTPTVEEEFYDDPQTNENMFNTPANMSYRLAQKLPVTNFDYKDVVTYDDENKEEQTALEKQVEAKARASKTIELLRNNITEAFNELGFRSNNVKKQEVLKTALGDEYVAGKKVASYTRIAQAEKILNHLRGLIAARRMATEAVSPEETIVYATSGSVRR